MNFPQTEWDDILTNNFNIPRHSIKTHSRHTDPSITGLYVETRSHLTSLHSSHHFHLRHPKSFIVLSGCHYWARLLLLPLPVPHSIAAFSSSHPSKISKAITWRYTSQLSLSYGSFRFPLTKPALSLVLMSDYHFPIQVHTFRIMTGDNFSNVSR